MSHAFKTSTWRGRGQAQVGAYGWGGAVSSMWMSTRKFRAHCRHPVFFSCKEVGVFLYQNFVFGGHKKWKFFVNIK